MAHSGNECMLEDYLDETNFPSQKNASLLDFSSQPKVTAYFMSSFFVMNFRNDFATEEADLCKKINELSGQRLDLMLQGKDPATTSELVASLSAYQPLDQELTLRKE